MYIADLHHGLSGSLTSRLIISLSGPRGRCFCRWGLCSCSSSLQSSRRICRQDSRRFGLAASRGSLGFCMQSCQDFGLASSTDTVLVAFGVAADSATLFVQPPEIGYLSKEKCLPFLREKTLPPTECDWECCCFFGEAVLASTAHCSKQECSTLLCCAFLALHRFAFAVHCVPLFREKLTASY